MGEKSRSNWSIPCPWRSRSERKRMVSQRGEDAVREIEAKAKESNEGKGTQGKKKEKEG